MGNRYIGAKTKVLHRILEQVSSLVPPGGRVVDLMCGTASVSAALRGSGFRVTANDIMTFCYHHARVALLFTAPSRFEHAKAFVKNHSNGRQGMMFSANPYQEVLQALNTLPGEEGYFWREYSIAGHPRNTAKPRNYFSVENAKRIDAIRTSIKELKAQGQINDLEHSLLLHDLIMAVNDVANIAGTYGHYLSELAGRARCPLTLKPSVLDLRDDAGRHAVFKGYAEDLARTLACDLCYIDPPYMKRQYAANYHILETIAREDEPEAIGISGLRPWRDQYSNFCTKTKIRDSFARIFTDMQCKDFLVSYSEDGLLSITQLLEFFSGFGDAKFSTFSYKRFKSNRSSLSSELTEYLIHLRKA